MITNLKNIAGNKPSKLPQTFFRLMQLFTKKILKKS